MTNKAIAKITIAKITIAKITPKFLCCLALDFFRNAVDWAFWDAFLVVGIASKVVCFIFSRLEARATQQPQLRS